MRSGYSTLRFQRMGKIFKSRCWIERERTACWAVAMAIMLYHLGLSLRRTALFLSLHRINVSHVAIWYWIQKIGKKWAWHKPMPSTLVLDETCIKLKGRLCWVFTALDPETWQVVYMEPSYCRNAATVRRFMENMAEVYGKWPNILLSDGGSWYSSGLRYWKHSSKFAWWVIRGGVRNSIEGFYGEFLKRRVKDFDCYCPSRKLKSMRRWLWSYCWLHNGIRDGLKFY